jgi:hypothetical protein
VDELEEHADNGGNDDVGKGVELFAEEDSAGKSSL